MEQVEKIILKDTLRKIEDLHKDKYNIFENVCIYCDEKDIEDYIKEYNVNVNYDDGHFLEIICMRNDIKLLKMIIRNNADIHINNEGITRLAAHEGLTEIFKFLLENYNINYKILYKSTACSNYSEIAHILNDFAETRKQHSRRTKSNEISRK